MQLTARIWPEEGGFVADCVELSVVSQGDTENEALANLQEAVEGFLECADPDEVRERMHAQQPRMHVQQPPYTVIRSRAATIRTRAPEPGSCPGSGTRSPA
jgi:predicted RNase H-like HicB family nuclease